MINGFINLYKEKGMTSSKAVGKLKHILRENNIDCEKIGHTGTLDPDGEGVLPIALGRATRLFDYFLEKRKVYYTEFRFGLTTDTLDTSGVTLQTDDNVDVDAKDIIKTIPILEGIVDQIPPAYSAKSINGVRSYKLARKGENPTLKAKTIEIHKIELLDKIGKNEFSFRITCSGGTYIRSIARDMGKALGTLCVMQYIRREESGGFTIKNAYKLSEIELEVENKIIPMDEICKVFPKYNLPKVYQNEVLNGGHPIIEGLPENTYFSLYFEEKLIGICNLTEEKGLNIKTRLL